MAKSSWSKPSPSRLAGLLIIFCLFLFHSLTTVVWKCKLSNFGYFLRTSRPPLKKFWVKSFWLSFNFWFANQHLFFLPGMKLSDIFSPSFFVFIMHAKQKNQPECSKKIVSCFYFENTEVFIGKNNCKTFNCNYIKGWGWTLIDMEVYILDCTRSSINEQPLHFQPLFPFRGYSGFKGRRSLLGIKA